MTSIEWTRMPGFQGESWNFVTGCTMGCGYCYAAKMAGRFWGDRNFADVQFHADRVGLPLTWRKPRCAFVNSMGDWADPLVSPGWLDQALEVMLNTPQHRYLLLTKQPQRAFDYLSQIFCDRRQLPGHIWIGTSIENQVAAEGRHGAAQALAEICEVTWVSYEPAIGPVDWSGWEFLRWLVIGGMSGRDATYFDLHWARFSIDWCRSAGIVPFVKQLGSNPMGFDGEMQLVGKGRPRFGNSGPWRALQDPKGADWEEWPRWLKVREWPV